MEGLNSEVANKMRSAVKAKLIELGSGTAGYIDDELPDYVMIMVANKRSKEQMTGDLSLFLGKNTDNFVNWLHQVLEKLEEVTLPAAAAQPKKRKTSETEKRDKDKKKLNRKRSVKEKSPEPVRSTTPPIQCAPPSITDVFADHLIQKATKVIEPPMNVKKAERNGASNDDNFDIPTISEIARKSVTTNVRKEFTELAELQKKIDQAKRQLRHMTDESEDEDFISIRTDRNDLDGGDSGGNNNSNDVPSDRFPAIIPTVEHKQKPMPMEKLIEEPIEEPIQRPIENREKRSVRDRLGTRGNMTDKTERSDKNENIISLSAHRRMEQAIYVPAHRRNADQSTNSAKKSERDRSLDRSDNRRLSMREIQRENRLGSSTTSTSRSTQRKSDQLDLREKVRQRNRDIEQRSTRSKRDVSRERTTRDQSVGANRSDIKPSLASRIGSRIIVAQTETNSRQLEQREDDEEDDDIIQKPVNSVIKVQPRPIVPRNRQASKNLLLRAVAEAQKSIETATTKIPAVPPPPPPQFKVSEKNIGGKKELYTKSFRNKFINDTIVVEVNQVIDLDESADVLIAEGVDEEYIPASGSIDDDEALVYVPQTIHDESLKINDSETKTQFVVTLDSLEYRTKKRAGPQRKKVEVDLKRVRIESKPIQKKIETRGRTLRPQKNDSESESELRKAVEISNNQSLSLKRKRTPIRFDIDENTKANEPKSPKKRRSHSNDRKSLERISTHSKSEEKDDKARSESRDRDESGSRIRTVKTSSQNKYDNLPPLPSAITVTQNETKLPVKKERCKFYPACTRGERCEYIHPSTPCKAFPNCKFGDKCLYIHPKCKFDLTCSRLNCNFSHTPVASAAPPLASHVVPVSNYKKIVTSPLPTLCRFYPNCSNTLCDFYHPKPCKFGKSCTNKIECNFYHYDLPTGPSAPVAMKNKLKWVASTV